MTNSSCKCVIVSGSLENLCNKSSAFIILKQRLMMQKAIQKQRWWIVHKYNLHDSSQRYCKRSGLAFGDFKSRRQTVLAVHGTWSCCCSWLLTFVYRHFFRPVSSVDWTVNFECNCHSCGFFGTMGWKRNRAIRVMHCGQCSEHHCCHVKVTESCSLHRHMCCARALSSILAFWPQYLDLMQPYMWSCAYFTGYIDCLMDYYRHCTFAIVKFFLICA